MLFYLLLHRPGPSGPRLRLAGRSAWRWARPWPRLLVALREHTPAEALAGWCLGALVSPLAIRLAAPFAPLPALAGLCAFALMFAGSLDDAAGAGRLLDDPGRALSGNTRPATRGRMFSHWATS
jgi:hypothetical protein